MPEHTIAHFIRRFASPTEVFIVNQINSLRGFTPLIFCHHRHSQAPQTEAEVFSLVNEFKGQRAFVQRSAYSLGRLLIPSAVRRLVEELRFRKAGLLHFHYLVDARFFLPVIRKSGLPCVVSCYGWDVSRFPRAWGGLGRIYLRQVFPRIDIVLAMSEDMKRALLSLGFPEEKIVVHYYGVPVERYSYPDRRYDRGGEVKILFCGRLVPKKGPGLLLDALEIMERQGLASNPWHLRFIGDGPLKAGLEERVDKMGWRERVSLSGYIPNQDRVLVEAYRQADLFCLPSLTAGGDKEGIPGTMVEAMASGLPVISTRHAGIPEVVSNEVEGSLFEEGDVEALARALARAVSDPTWREEKGRAAALRARGLDLHARTADLEKIYHQLISRR